MDFEKICMLFTMQEPYYGIILSSMDRRPNKNMETLGVWQSGNVFKLSYNPDFVESLPIDTTLQLLKHECLHIAFNHFTLWDDNNVSPAVHRLCNIAADLEVNCYLDRSKIVKEAGGAFAEDMGFDKKLGARRYFQLLKQKAEQEQEDRQKAAAQAPQKPCNGGQNGQSQEQNDPSNQQQNTAASPQNSQNGQSNQPQKAQPSNSGNVPSMEKIMKEMADSVSRFDDHSMWPEEMDEAMKVNLQQQVDDLLVFAAEEVEKGRGVVPGELKGRITDIRNRKKPRPVADWKRYFRRYIGNEFSEELRKSKKRESKRFPDAAGTRHKRKSHILVAIDTSGSVSMPEYREFMGQIATLTNNTTFHVVECDTRIVHEYDFNRMPNEELHGGGGTDFQPPIDLFLANRRKYEGIIYFTDGGAPIPHNTPKEMLWVISSRGNHDRRRYKVNGASVVIIPKQK